MVQSRCTAWIVCGMLFPASDPGSQTDGRPDGTEPGGNPGIHVCGAEVVWAGWIFAGTGGAFDDRRPGGIVLEAGNGCINGLTFLSAGIRIGKMGKLYCAIPRTKER